MRTDRRDILVKVGALNVWRDGDTRAPHKPLLLLLALSRLIHGEERLVRFADVEEELADLLRAFGPPRSQVHPEYPFWWLQSDGLWEVQHPDLLTRRQSNHNPTRTALRRTGLGGFPEPLDTMLRHNAPLVRQVVSLLLHSHFPESMHESVLNAVGIESDICVALGKRDGQFRTEVLEAYGHRCAVCGFDIQLGSGIDLALEAAHVKWRQAGGPDVVQNGLALCSIHHKALDFGAITFDESLRVIVSGSAYGGEASTRWFLKFHRKHLGAPHSPSLRIQPAFAAWHLREVFRSPARA